MVNKPPTTTEAGGAESVVSLSGRRQQHAEQLASQLYDGKYGNLALDIMRHFVAAEHVIQTDVGKQPDPARQAELRTLQAANDALIFQLDSALSQAPADVREILEQLKRELLAEKTLLEARLSRIEAAIADLAEQVAEQGRQLAGLQADATAKHVSDEQIAILGAINTAGDNLLANAFLVWAQQNTVPCWLTADIAAELTRQLNELAATAPTTLPATEIAAIFLLELQQPANRLSVTLTFLRTAHASSSPVLANFLAAYPLTAALAKYADSAWQARQLAILQITAAQKNRAMQQFFWQQHESEVRADTLQTCHALLISTLQRWPAKCQLVAAQWLLATPLLLDNRAQKLRALSPAQLAALPKIQNVLDLTRLLAATATSELTSETWESILDLTKKYTLSSDQFAAVLLANPKLCGYIASESNDFVRALKPQIDENGGISSIDFVVSERVLAWLRGLDVDKATDNFQQALATLLVRPASDKAEADLALQLPRELAARHLLPQLFRQLDLKITPTEDGLVVNANERLQQLADPATANTWTAVRQRQRLLAGLLRDPAVSAADLEQHFASLAEVLLPPERSFHVALPLTRQLWQQLRQPQNQQELMAKFCALLPPDQPAELKTELEKLLARELPASLLDYNAGSDTAVQLVVQEKCERLGVANAKKPKLFQAKLCLGADGEPLPADLPRGLLHHTACAAVFATAELQATAAGAPPARAVLQHVLERQLQLQPANPAEVAWLADLLMELHPDCTTLQISVLGPQDWVLILQEVRDAAVREPPLSQLLAGLNGDVAARLTQLLLYRPTTPQLAQLLQHPAVSTKLLQTAVQLNVEIQPPKDAENNLLTNLQSLFGTDMRFKPAELQQLQALLLGDNRNAASATFDFQRLPTAVSKLRKTSQNILARWQQNNTNSTSAKPKI